MNAKAGNLQTKYQLLEEILAIKSLPLQPMYTTRDLAELFSVSARSVQNWMSSGKLIPRNLPGTLEVPDTGHRGLPQSQSRE
jgi:hypothetical protein